MKYSFKNDYLEGCHPAILEALMKHNLDQQLGYGEDVYSKEAKQLINKKLQRDSQIHFVSGGTQANLIVISALLKPYQCVISAATGHILNNETGAIEATGHKIISVETEDGKLKPEHVKSVLENHQNKPHQVMPKLVYISNSTELGTIYSKSELTELSHFCRNNGLILYMDGARLGHGLSSHISELSLFDIGNLTDVFYLGGTKNGALLGEAIIINNEALFEDFAFSIKQKGGLLAKGRLLGIQFLELMKNDLYFELAKNANVQALKISDFLKTNNISFLAETVTNQVFPILDNSVIDALAENFEFYIWKKINDEQSAIRLITSWNTSDQAVEDFIEAVKNCI